MKIRKLILENIQKHDHLEINFSNDITIIHGQSDGGKSACIRALRWVCFDDFNSNELRKHGTKKSSATIVLDNQIEISRIKSASINAYEVKNGKEIKRYDSIGSGVPEDIQSLLGMELFEVEGIKVNLNIAEQLAASFLIGKEFSSTWRSKLFNKLSGNDIQDKLAKQLNKELLQFSKDSQECEKQNEELNKELIEVKEKKENIQAILGDLENTLVFLEELEEKKLKLISLQEKLKENKSNFEFAQFKVDSIKIIGANQLTKIDLDLSTLEKYKKLYENIQEVVRKYTKITQELSLIKNPKIDFDKIREKIAILEDLKNLEKKLDSNEESHIDFCLDIKALERQIKADEVLLEEERKKSLICPTCGQKICKESK